MACEENALRYEQLGYYTGGAAQFNAVITACTSSSNSEDEMVGFPEQGVGGLHNINNSPHHHHMNPNHNRPLIGKL